MTNLFNDYFSKVEFGCWQGLYDVVLSQHEAIVTTIENDYGPVRKTKAKEALNGLDVALKSLSLQSIAS